MLQGLNQTPPEASPADDAVLVPRDLIERMKGELRFKQVKIEALTFELAGLKRKRFGASSESLDPNAQAVLFDRILADIDCGDRWDCRPLPIWRQVLTVMGRRACRSATRRLRRELHAAPTTR